MATTPPCARLSRSSCRTAWRAAAVRDHQLGGDLQLVEQVERRLIEVVAAQPVPAAIAQRFQPRAQVGGQRLQPGEQHTGTLQPHLHPELLRLRHQRASAP